MNIHLPSSLEGESELRNLTDAKYMMITPQSSKPIFCIVQDSLLSAYKMTLGIVPIRKEVFYSILMSVEISVEDFQKKIQDIRRVYKEKGKKVQAFHGKGLFSMILPPDFNYVRENKTNSAEPVLRIHKGVLYEGTLDKTCLGTSVGSIIHCLYKEYGVDRAAKFIDEVQFICNRWILVSGFSIGLGDCMVQGEKSRELVEDVIKKCYVEAEVVKRTTANPLIQEIRIMGALSKARDVGMRISKEALDPENGFIKTVKSGSKGDSFNVAQMSALIGQQDVEGKRVKPCMSNGKRTLPHYHFGDLEPEKEYESKGFIASSFIKGMNPREFYFNLTSSRVAVVNTSLNTATSGYMNRRIAKLTEDVKVQYDGTVRDTTNGIFQYAYGETGYDPKKTIKINGVQQVCDVSVLVQKMNQRYEKENKISV